MSRETRGRATRVPLPSVGSCFYLAWMNGTFFTSALSAFEETAALGSSVGSHWDLSLLGVFLGLVTLTLAERRFGQLALRRRFVSCCTVAVCAGTTLMLLDSSLPGVIWDVLGMAGAFATGFFSSAYYIAWTSVYASLSAEESEIAIPLAVALGQLLAIVLCGFKGWLAVLSVLAAPLLNTMCLRACEADLTRRSSEDARDSARVPPATSSEAKASRPALLDWRCGAFMATIWFVLSTLTAMTKQTGEPTFADAYLVPFVASFLVLVILLAAYVNFAKRLTLLEASRAVLPIMAVSLAALMILPDESASIAFLVGRAGAMLFWALVWICCADVVRSGRASATRTAGTVRGWIQGGAAASIPALALISQTSLDVISPCFTTLLAVVFAITLPSLMKASEGHPAAECADSPAPSKPGDLPLAESLVARCEQLAETYGLSPREREVMECLLRGRNLPYIRETLCISRNTINTHVRHIYAKMGIHSKQELIDLYERNSEERS